MDTSDKIVNTKEMEPEKMQEAIDRMRALIDEMDAQTSKGATLVVCAEEGFNLVSYMEASDVAEAIYIILQKDKYIMDAFRHIMNLQMMAEQANQVKMGNFFQMSKDSGNA